MASDPVGPEPEDPQNPEDTKVLSRPPSRAGRNLPAAVAVGAGLGGLVFLTLLTVKATFLLYVGIALAVALTELAEAFAKRDIKISVIPVAAGGAAVLTCTYWLGSRAALAALALTMVTIFAWRLPGGPSGYVKDVTAGVFATIYLSAAIQTGASSNITTDTDFQLPEKELRYVNPYPTQALEKLVQWKAQKPEPPGSRRNHLAG